MSFPRVSGRLLKLGAPLDDSSIKESATMAEGTVKWFNTTKGYGFIQPAQGGNDVFVHISAVQRAGLQSLADGQKVEYELQSERGKTAAVDLKIL